MAAGQTYVPIATTTLGSAAASYTFSSIPSTYTDLVLILNAANTSGNQAVRLTFNGDSATNYSKTGLSGNGTSAFSTRDTTSAFIGLDTYSGTSTTANAATYVINIMNYTNTTTYKNAISRANNAGYGVDLIVGLWRSTAAITSLTLTSTGTFTAGSTFTLYGIAAA